MASSARQIAGALVLSVRPLIRVAGVLVAIVALLLVQRNSNESEPLLIATFDDGNNSFSARLLSHPSVSLVKGAGVDVSDAIRVLYEGYARGSRRVVLGHTLPTALNEATLSYDARFCDEFDFVKGGKLHGLGPRDPVTGGLAVGKDQWSARVIFKRDGGIASYLYHQELPGQYGEEMASQSFRFEPGRYYSVSLYVRINDPATASNGHTSIYVDGDLIIEHSGVRLRGAPGSATLINRVLFNTFHGGHTEDFAPRNKDGSFSTECAYFDNFTIHPYLAVRGGPST